MAAANDICVDSAAPAVLSELGGIFVGQKDKEQH